MNTMQDRYTKKITTRSLWIKVTLWQHEERAGFSIFTILWLQVLIKFRPVYVLQLNAFCPYILSHEKRRFIFKNFG
jgi:hypothetical protein